MNSIPINGYESVFEPFFDGGESYSDHKKFSTFKENYRVENLNCSDYKITQSWAALDIVFVPENQSSSLKLSRKCKLSVSGYDVLRVYCSCHKNCKLKITAEVDGEIKDLGTKLLTDKVEYDFPINGNEVSMLIIELSGAEQNREAFVSLSWLGLCNTKEEAFESTRKYEFGSDWQGCFNNENDFSVQTFAYFDNEELEAIREKVKKPPFDKIFGKLKSSAKKHLKDEPEKLIEDYLLPPENNWRRQRDLNKPFLLAGAEELAFVGLVEKNREMLISACRKALSAAVTPFWCPSEICRMSGATWHPRCFYEMNAARILSRVYSFAGSVLTWHGKNLIKTAIATKGLPRMEYDIGYLDYIKKCNQGIVFNSARAESYLCLAYEHKGYERMLENCASDLNEMKGDWDEDKTVSDINVTYTSNTFLQPGDSFVIRGSNIAENVSRVEVIPFENGTEIAGETVSDYIDRTWHDFGGVQKGEHTKEPVAPSYSAGSPAWDDISVAIGLNIVQKTTDSLKVILPTEKADGTELKHCMFALKLYDYDDDTDSGDKVIYINAPYIDYVMGVDGDSSAAGEEIRIIGENIAPDQDNGKALDELKVRLTNKKTKATRYLDVKEVQSDYSVSVDLPHDIENGTYEVSVYNGFGDSTCWSIPSDIKVDGNIRNSFPDTVYNIKDFGATGLDDQNCTPIIASALAAISKKGGGVLYFPEGVYRIEYTVYVPENITIKGDGVNKTHFLSVMYRFNYNAMPENGLFMFDSNVAFEDFQVVATRAPIFFMADCQGKDTESVKNIYFSNVKFYWQPLAGKVTQGSSGMNMLVSNAEAQAMTIAENNHNIISFGKGYVENLQMDKLDFLNKETIQGGLFYCYNARTKYVRVTNLVSKNASYQTCISSNAIWENNVFDGGCTALQGRNIYLENNTFRNNTTNNRELFVADHNGGICHFAQYLDKDGKWDGVTLKTVDVGLYGWGEQCGVQLFVTGGSGVGQTRKIVETNEKEGWVRVDSPFTIEVNRNSSFVYRVPREDIYFVNTTFKNGFAGGFYGGASDIVYDGTKHIEHINAAQNAQFNDVNWYFTFKDETWTYDPFGLAIETSLKKESSYTANSNNSFSVPAASLKSAVSFFKFGVFV